MSVTIEKTVHQTAEKVVVDAKTATSGVLTHDLAVDLETLSTPQMVDLAGRIAEGLETVKNTYGKRYKEVTDRLRPLADGEPAAEPVVLEGAGEFVGKFSVVPSVRRIKDASAVMLQMKLEDFLKIASVPVSALDKYLTPEDHQALRDAGALVDEPGSRTLKFERAEHGAQ